MQTITEIELLNIVETLVDAEYKNVIDRIRNGSIRFIIASKKELDQIFPKNERPYGPSNKKRIQPTGWTDGETMILIKESSVPNMIYLLGHEMTHILQHDDRRDINVLNTDYSVASTEIEADRAGRKFEQRFKRHIYEYHY